MPWEDTFTDRYHHLLVYKRNRDFVKKWCWFPNSLQ